jgi:hypothetical protein
MIQQKNLRTSRLYNLSSDTMNSSTIQTPTIMNLKFMSLMAKTVPALKTEVRNVLGACPSWLTKKQQLIVAMMWAKANPTAVETLADARDTILTLAHCLTQYEERKEQRFGNMDATIRDLRAICEACAIHQEALGVL